jgi:hypothetical protein
MIHKVKVVVDTETPGIAIVQYVYIDDAVIPEDKWDEAINDGNDAWRVRFWKNVGPSDDLSRHRD